MNSVEEESAAFAPAPAALSGLGKYRTFGSEGPMYQVLEVRGDRVLVWLSNSDDEVELSLASIVADPLAH